MTMWIKNPRVFRDIFGVFSRVFALAISVVLRSDCGFLRFVVRVVTTKFGRFLGFLPPFLEMSKNRVCILRTSVAVCG